MTAIATPYTLSAQEYVDALTATSHALHNEVVRMHYRVESMSPQARREFLAGLDVLRDTLHSMVQRDLAAAVLTPDAVPDYVEGWKPVHDRGCPDA